MDKQTLEYLKKKIESAEKLQKAITKLEEFIEQLQRCKENESIILSIATPGYYELKLAQGYDGLTSEFILKHFYGPLMDAAQSTLTELEEEFEKL